MDSTIYQSHWIRDSLNRRGNYRDMDLKVFKAARKGDVLFLDNITRQGDELQEYLCSRTHQRNNIIHIAARLGHEAFVNKALDKCTLLLHQENSKGDTPLHVAAKAGHVSLVKFLTEYATKMTTPGVLHGEATTLNSHRDIQEGGAVEPPPLWRMENREKNTALHEALRYDRKEVALFLLDLDPELASSVNGARESPLYLAAEARLHSVLCKIVNQTSFSEAGPIGRNPLHAAVFTKRLASIRVLINKRPELIKLADSYGKTALHYAAEANSIGIIRMLLRKDKTCAYEQDNDGNSPLHVAASSVKRRAVQVIIKYCPDTTELLNNTGRNALHLAVRKNIIGNVRRFLKLPEMRELINEQDDEGNTPLHIATMFHHYLMVRGLIQTGCADLRAKNKKGLTALDICESQWKISHRQAYLWRYLRRHKASRSRDFSSQASRLLGGRFTHPKVDLKLVANTLSVVAALLTTVTFAAAFTMPGGYNNSVPNVGAASLAKKAALKAFVLSDTYAMCCSMTAVFVLTSAMVGDPAFLVRAVDMSRCLLIHALYGSMVAFETGLFAVLSPDSLWLAIVVCVMASSVPFLQYFYRHASAIATPYSIRLQRSDTMITKEQEENMIEIVEE
ncbi:hypothetical protein HHK36_000885 [Tetracentron sinense]|uniref:PGG domain-containing protein n=1 Tax=Tetracentron sinense TaxID=13715 RepID=A0A834ZX59_TETSI|nr:hypothetical protein HHK36_000885 [Tetracentron sinense]